MKQKIWIIGEPYAPEENTTAYYLTQTAEGLARKFDVSVLCGQPSYLSRGVRAPARENRNEVDVKRCWGTTLDKNILPFRLLNMLTLGGSMFFNTLFKIKKSDKVLVVTAPPSLPFLVALACQIRGVPFVFLLHDLYPEVLIATGNAKPKDFLVMAINRLNRWLYKQSEKIIVVGRDMQDLIEEKMSASDNDKNGGNKKTVVIQNWASLEEVEPQPRDENKLLQESSLEDKFVLLYAGNMGPPQDVESIVDCAKMLKEKGIDDIHFLFVGAGGKKKKLEQIKQDFNLTNVSILGARPREEQIIFLNACDIALIPLVKGFKGVAMPSRTYNFLAAGKPLIGIIEEGAELWQVIKEERVGWAVPPHEPQKLLEVILQAKENKELAEKGKRARVAAVERYSFEVALAKYEKLFETEKSL
jgi:colanic acid biosynthesis glycosyl transferase WcaI